MDSGASWLLSRIWFWAKTNPSDIGPLGVFLPLGLYGVYIVVFSMCMWTTYRDERRFSGVRWVVVATFVAVTLYMVATLVSYPLAAAITGTSPPLLRFGLVAAAWCNMSACICCSLSDSVLAWRCYVIFGKRRWLKWTLAITVFVITIIGMCFSIILLLAEWEAYDGQQDTIVPDLLNLLQFPTTLTWAACSLALNTVLSTSIIAKIVMVSRQTSQHTKSALSIPLARAFIESSLLSWIALAVYTGLYIASDLLPTSALISQGQVTLKATLPLIFSISQTLVIARLGVSRFAASTSFKSTICALTSDHHDDSAPRSPAVAHQDVESWNNQAYID